MRQLNQFLRNIKTELVAVDAARVGKWWDFKNLNSPYSRLYLITEGCGYVTHHNNTYKLTPGTLHLVPRFTFHTIECDGCMDHFFLHFLCEIADGIDIFTMNDYEYSVKAPPECLPLFKRLIDLNPNRCLIDQNYRNRDVYQAIYKSDFEIKDNELLANSIESEGIIKQLMAPILRTQSKCVSSLENFNDDFMRLFDYIHKNISRSIGLEELAQVVHLNPTYFSDKFTKVMGIRPVQYILKKRIETAQIMLMDFNNDISHIAYATGFCDVAHFTKTFTKRIGLTPSKYRQAFHRSGI